MKHTILVVLLLSAILAACAPVNLNAPLPLYDTGLDPNAWATIPAGSFLSGQDDKQVTIGQDYQMMITDVTVDQYVDFLNKALADGTVKVNGEGIVGAYPGDPFHGAKHEIRIDPGDYILVPLNDPASPFAYDGRNFSAKTGWENHPMANVSWFGAWRYCRYYNWRLPTEVEWEKAARGSTDNRPFPWGDSIVHDNANYYKSGDPFENMATVGSRTSPVGFYNGRTYGTYTTIDSPSPYGLYDMSGNVWQWVGDVQPGFSDRLMHGGSKDTYDMDLRIWVTNSAAPMYYGPDVGFRCARG
jgi:formylglycine-generating enzyme required for sulfatase activity